ncbi:unnamed protein product [Ectocarpus sp. 12 AP-2014]
MVNGSRRTAQGSQPVANLVRFSWVINVSVCTERPGHPRLTKNHGHTVSCGGGFDRVHMLNDSLKPKLPRCNGAFSVHSREHLHYPWVHAATSGAIGLDHQPPLPTGHNHRYKRWGILLQVQRTSKSHQHVCIHHNSRLYLVARTNSKRPDRGEGGAGGSTGISSSAGLSGSETAPNKQPRPGRVQCDSPAQLRCSP